MKTPTETLRLEYWNGKKWIHCGNFFNEWSAWTSLGNNNLNYRTVDALGHVLTDKRTTQPTPRHEQKTPRCDIEFAHFPYGGPTLISRISSALAFARTLECALATKDRELAEALAGKTPCVDDDGTPFASARSWRTVASNLDKQLATALREQQELNRLIKVENDARNVALRERDEAKRSENIAWREAERLQEQARSDEAGWVQLRAAHESATQELAALRTRKERFTTDQHGPRPNTSHIVFQGGYCQIVIERDKETGEPIADIYAIEASKVFMPAIEELERRFDAAQRASKEGP